MKEWDKDVMKMWRKINTMPAELDELMDEIDNYLNEDIADLDEATDAVCLSYSIPICSLLRDAIYYNAKLILM